MPKYQNQQYTRRSSLAPKGGRPSTIFSQRNVQSEKEENIRVLAEFLVEHKFPDEVSVRTLKSPPTNYVVNIFLFLFNKFNPNLVEFERFQDDVKTLLTLYGFPFSLAKSYLQAPNAPSSWPYILSSIVWLVELYQYGQKPSNRTTSEKGALEALALTAEQYKSFLSGSDMDEVQQGIRERHEERQQEMANETEEQKRAVEELESETAQLRKRPTAAQRKAAKDKLEKDIEKFEKLLDRKKAHIEALAEKTREYQSQDDETRREFAKLSSEEKRLQKEVRGQEIKPEEIDQMRREGKKLQQDLNSLQRAQKEKLKRLENAESQKGVVRNSLDAAADQLNERLRAISVVPAEAKLAYDNNYALAINHDAGFAEGEDISASLRRATSVDLRGSLKPHLQQIHRLLAEEKIKQEAEVAQLEAHLQDLSERERRAEREKEEVAQGLVSMKNMIEAKARQFEEERDRANQRLFSKQMDAFSADSGAVEIFELVGKLNQLTDQFSNSIAFNKNKGKRLWKQKRKLAKRRKRAKC
ncbi:hypothetical protein MHBO_000230 [Bonamia ostreae]|uniref:Kinetochore protein NDC80 n=1 Tax=Bonamia ostreae TaxID=126728 RepID=A0ABV2AEV9_9EUKA